MFQAFFLSLMVTDSQYGEAYILNVIAFVALSSIKIGYWLYV